MSSGRQIESKRPWRGEASVSLQGHGICTKHMLVYVFEHESIDLESDLGGKAIETSHRVGLSKCFRKVDQDGSLRRT